MNTVWITLTAALALLAGPGQAQDAEAVTTLKDFQQRAERIRSGVGREALIEEAFASQRLDLIRICFYTTGGVLEKVKDMPASPLRDDLMLMMMEAWWETDSIQPISRGVPELMFLLIDELGLRMPEEGLSRERPSGERPSGESGEPSQTTQRFEYRPARLDLALRFRTLLERERGLAPGTLQPPPPDRTKEPPPPVWVRVPEGYASAALYPGDLLRLWNIMESSSRPDRGFAGVACDQKKE